MKCLSCHFVVALLGVTTVLAEQDSVSKVQACCAALTQTAPRKVSLPWSVTYKASVASYWSLQARQAPSCIFSPVRPEDVSTAVKTLVKYNCKFAVRGGGHTPQANSGANIDGGVTIDLSALNKVELSHDNTTTLVGAGARWGNVYSYLDPLNYAVVGGRVSDVGVGGLLTGGGNSFFTARYGFACDNVVEYEIVLASGEVVRANKKTRPDLFRAMKGASNNLGIVTRFELATFPQTAFWGGEVFYPIQTQEQHNQAFVDFTNHIEQDQYSSLIYARGYDAESGQTIIANAYEYTKGQAYPPAFAKFTAIKPEYVNTMRIATMSSFADELGARSRPDANDLFMALAFANDLDTMRKVNAIGDEILEKYKQISGLQWFVIYQPLPRIFTDHSLERGGNILGLDREAGNQVLFLLNVVWTLSSDDALVAQAVQEMMTRVKAVTAALGTDKPYIYLNYAYPEQDPIKGYGPEGVNLLREASKKYDPKGVFQNLVPGGFKVSKVI